MIVIDDEADQRATCAAADGRAAYGRKRRTLIREDYQAFAYGAIEDLRRAMQGRSLATEEALPLLLLWSAVAVHCAGSETLMQEFCTFVVCGPGWRLGRVRYADRPPLRQKHADVPGP